MYAADKTRSRKRKKAANKLRRGGGRGAARAGASLAAELVRHLSLHHMMTRPHTVPCRRSHEESLGNELGAGVAVAAGVQALPCLPCYLLIIPSYLPSTGPQRQAGRQAGCSALISWVREGERAREMLRMSELFEGYGSADWGLPLLHD